MLITHIQIAGRETVIEFHHVASWLDFRIEPEGEWDTHVYLGKIALVQTNLWQQRPHLITKVIAWAIGLTVASATAHALGYQPLDFVIPNTGPR